MSHSATSPAAAGLAAPGGLYLVEKEVAQRVGVSEKTWRRLAPMLERDGLPRKDALIGKRYWPAVRAWLDRRHAIHGTIPASAQDGEENWG